MEQWLLQTGSADTFGFATESTAIACIGVTLFVLLGVYAALLLNAERLPPRVRLPTPAGLKPRLTIALVLVATLPAISLALVLSDRAGRQRAEREATALQVQADAAARGLDYILDEKVDPARVKDLLSQSRARMNGGLVVTDGAGRLISAPHAPGLAWEPGALRSAAGTAAQTDGKPFTFYMRPADGAPEQFIGAAARTGDGWRVLRFAPTAALRAASLQEYGVALGWLIAALIVSVCLAVALADSIAGPLGALDAAVRQFDPELDRELPQPPAHAPREVVVVFEHLATVSGRLRDSYAQLRQALRKGERLRHELITVIDNREQEIEGRTEQLKLANAMLDRLSRSDVLTGVANRRGFAEFLDRAWRAGLREQRPLSILMIDIDHFKAYNDAYGHQRGDTCLKAVADAISHVAGRPGDLVSRYGGEEFVVVLGNTPLEGALQVGEDVRAAIQGLAIPHRGAPEHAVVTVTVGVTSTLPAKNIKPDVCLAAADRALYAAKEQGRNRVGYSTAAHTGLFQSLCLPNDPAPRPS